MSIYSVLIKIKEKKADPKVCFFCDSMVGTTGLEPVTPCL